MATYYWVGGSGTWDTTSTANWSDTSGGSSGFGPPTSADDVIFDAASNVGTGAFTVTVSAAVCRDFSTGGAGGALDGAMTLAMGTSTLTVHGSWTNPAVNFAFSGTGTVTFASTTTGKTITTNGVSWPSAVTFNGVGGAWELGGAFTTTSTVTVTNGDFSTSASNYNLTASALSSSNSNIRTISLNGSTVTLSAGAATLSFATSTNLTFNAGTSTITLSNAGPSFSGGGQTFYNVTYSSGGSGNFTISGSNTFNNLTFTSRSATGLKLVVFAASQTINGTLTLGAANTAIRRFQVAGTTNTGTGVGTAITLTVATLATLADVDFRDITAAGASAPWSGTRIGDGGGNSNITFTAGATKYWNLAGGGNWSATAWATGSGGSVDVNNFPLAQDTVVIEDTGLNTSATITIDAGWWIPNIGASTRTNAFTLASGTTTPYIFGDFNIPSVATVTGTGVWYFGANNKTQLITTNGVTLTWAFVCNGTTNNTVRLAGNTTSTSGTINLTQGTFDLNNNTFTCVVFASSQSVVRTLAFGTGNITVTGNNQTIVSLGTVTNLTITGTPVFNATYSGSTGTRTFSVGTLGEASAISVNVSAGSDTVSFATTSGSYKNIIMTGFSGVMSFANSLNIFGNLTLSATQTVNSGTQTVGFNATSGTQTITSNGVTFDRGLNINAAGATVQLADALTMGSSRTLTLTAGTFTTTASNYNVTAGSFASSNVNVRTLSLNGSTVTINGGSWNIADATNLTLNSGTSTITMTSADAKSFAGGGKTYGSLNQGGAGDLTITGANTFADISNTVQPAKIIFPAGVKTIVNALSVSGTSGNLISLESSSSDAALIEYQP